MDIFELNHVLELKDIRKIEKKLRELGYFDLTTHPMLKHTSIVDICQTSYQKAYKELNTKSANFYGRVLINIQGSENYELVWIEYGRSNATVTQKVLIYAKKLEQNGI